MVGLLLLIPLLFAAAVWLGVPNGRWGGWAFSLLALLALFSGPAVMWCNYRIHSIRHECECGKPDYLFMGLLGRSSCHRCSSCGKLLRLRD